MSNQTPTPRAKRAGRSRSAGFAWRVAAIVEVLLAFSFVHLVYRSFKHFTELGQLEATAGLNFSPGIVMILFTLAVLLLSRRNFEEYGLTWKGWRYNLNVGLLWSVLIVLIVGLIVHFHLVHFDPLHPPDVARAVVFSSGEVIATALLIVFLMRERSLVRRVPPFVSFFVLASLVLLPVVLAIFLHRNAPNMVLRVLWLFFGAGLGEEIFFRGYIQSRINQSFGRPWRVLGLQ